ncbi:hypothetical protein ACFVW1_17010 [Streptomyces olivochromogenes]|uniref:hypothetical protein n=1 Tax=Streptomyces TaxID=1883 RepID=UPI0033DADF9D
MGRLLVGNEREAAGSAAIATLLQGAVPGRRPPEGIPNYPHPPRARRDLLQPEYAGPPPQV